MNLQQLLTLEWKKFSPNGTFRALAFLYLFFFILIVYLSHLVGHNFTVNTGETSINPLQDLFQFPRSWELVANLGSWLNALILSMMGVALITLEIGYRTLRQNIITGLLRGELFLAKVLFALTIALVATLWYLILGAITGLSMGHLTSWTEALPPLGEVGLFCLQAFAYLVFGMLLGLLTKQTAMGLILSLLYILILESVLYFILYFAVTKSEIIHYLPNEILRGLVPWPTPQAAQDFVKSQDFFHGPTPIATLLAALGYIGLFLALLAHRLRKSDL